MTRTRFRGCVRALGVGLALAAWACGGSTSISPTSPSRSNGAESGTLDHDDEVYGAISGLSGSCPTLTFTVQRVLVRTSAATTFEGVTCVRLANNTRVEVEGVRMSDGSIVAKVVELYY